MKRGLFEIGADLQALDQLCNEAEDALERGPEIDAALAAWFDGLKTEEDAKLEGYRLYIAKLESEAAAARAEAEQYQKMAQTRENRVKWLKDRMKSYMEFTHREKILTSTNRSFSIQKNGGVLPIIFEEGKGPEDAAGTIWVKLRYEWNIDVLRKSLENGGPTPFARLGDRGTHLRIR